MGSYDDGFKYYKNKQDARILSIVGGTYSSYIALAMFICAWDGKTGQCRTLRQLTVCSSYLISSASVAMSHTRAVLSSDADITRRLSDKNLVTFTGLHEYKGSTSSFCVVHSLKHFKTSEIKAGSCVLPRCDREAQALAFKQSMFCRESLLIKEVCIVQSLS